MSPGVLVIGGYTEAGASGRALVMPPADEASAAGIVAPGAEFVIGGVGLGAGFFPQPARARAAKIATVMSVMFVFVFMLKFGCQGSGPVV